MKEAAIVIIGIVVFLYFMSFVDRNTDADEEERNRREDE